MKTVLVLEDDENLREVIVDVLEDLGYRVYSAEDPETALRIAAEAVPEAVLADIRMAGPLDGLGVLERLKRQRPNLRAIVMTGYADDQAPLRALRIQVDDYLYKPFEIEDIVTALRRVEQSASQQQWFRRLLRRLTGQPSPEQLEEQLESAREEALKLFYVALRSGHLYAESALESWDAWEQLNGRPARSTPELQQALLGCREWAQQLSRKVAQGAFVSASPRAPQLVSRGDFKRFCERIKQGLISAEELSVAASLRRLPQALREADPESQGLWQKIWGAPADA